ncbi:hypothetical protein CRUP_024044, partial [Coryphaenoides rupestris]
MRTHVNHYKCPLCDMTCPSPSSLRNHIKFRHSNERPYSCEYCEYSCKNLVDLRKHLDTHTSEPAYCCDAGGCTYTARTVRTMKIHYKREHECFTRGNNLTVHLRKKHQFKWPSGHPRFRYTSPLLLLLLLLLLLNDTSEFSESETAWFPQQPEPQDDTYWSGTAPLCLGGCRGRHRELKTDPCGDSSCCW